MALLNTTLCIPPLDLAALLQGTSILAAPQRFIVPGRKFALSPRLLDRPATDLYNPDFLATSPANPSAGQASDTLPVLAWAECDLCQHIKDQDFIEALMQRTIWNADALATHLRNRGNLFLAILRVYRLSEPLSLAQPDSSRASLSFFLPLPDYLNVDTTHPVLDDRVFEQRKQWVLQLESAQPAAVKDPTEPTAEAMSAGTESALTEEEGSSAPEESATLPEAQIAKTHNILTSNTWYEKIAEVGNSSDGHTFEKLVRKGLIELGFSNTLNNPKISLDPNATGGAGGLDFYADLPYSIVGECKATKTEKVPSSTPAQLIYLGHKYLKKDEFEAAIKIVVAAGKLTKDAQRTALGSDIHILKPETLQRLVELKVKYPNAVSLEDIRKKLDEISVKLASLNSRFENPDASIDSELEISPSDKELSDFVDDIWKVLRKDISIRTYLIGLVKRFSGDKNEPVSLESIRLLFHDKGISGSLFMEDENINFKDIGPDQIRDLLIELSSPLTGYLGREVDSQGIERFYFVRPLKISA